MPYCSVKLLWLTRSLCIMLSVAGNFNVITAVIVEGWCCRFLLYYYIGTSLYFFFIFAWCSAFQSLISLWCCPEESMWLGQMKRIIIIPFIVGRTNHALNGNPACNEWHLYIVPIWRNKLPHTDQLLLIPSVEAWARVYVGERLRCYNKSTLNKQDFDITLTFTLIMRLLHFLFVTDQLVSN